MKWCATCGMQMVRIYDGTYPHKCPPKWRVYEPNGCTTGAVEVYARDAHDAAKKYARHAVPDDIADGLSVEVVVFGERSESRFEVTGRLEVRYDVRAVEGR